MLPLTNGSPISRLEKMPYRIDHFAGILSASAFCFFPLLSFFDMSVKISTKGVTDFDDLGLSFWLTPLLPNVPVLDAIDWAFYVEWDRISH
jgi:hypothetical protein